MGEGHLTLIPTLAASSMAVLTEAVLKTPNATRRAMRASPTWACRMLSQ